MCHHLEPIAEWEAFAAETSRAERDQEEEAEPDVTTDEETDEESPEPVGPRVADD